MLTRSCLAAVLVAALIPAGAVAADRNDDNIPDSWERAHGLSLKKNQANRDQDRDALRNRDEYRARMDPRDDDSDGDGTEDGDEGAGAIASFDPDTGELAINVFNGGRLSGLVAEFTHIECDDGDDHPPVKPPEDDHPPVKPPEDEDHPPVKPTVDDHKPAFGLRPGDPGEADPDDGDPDEGDEKECSAEHLVPGTVVQEAVLFLADGDAYWKEIELRR